MSLYQESGVLQDLTLQLGQWVPEGTTLAKVVHEFGHAYGGHDHVRGLDQSGQVLGAGMGHGHGGVLAHEQQGHGFAHDVAAAHDHGVGAVQVHAGAVKQLDAAVRGAGQEHAGRLDVRVFLDGQEFAHVDGVESVHVFGGVDEIEHLVVAQALGQGELHEDAVYGVVVVEIFDQFVEIGLAGGGGQLVLNGLDAALFACDALVAHVHLGCGVFADQNHGQSGLHAGLCFEFGYAFGDFVLDGLGDGVSVDDFCGHEWTSSIIL